MIFNLISSGVSRMRAGQGIWILRQDILGLLRSLSVMFGANGLFKDTFIFEGDVSQSPLDTRFILVQLLQSYSILYLSSFRFQLTWFYTKFLACFQWPYLEGCGWSYHLLAPFWKILNEWTPLPWFFWIYVQKPSFAREWVTFLIRIYIFFTVYHTNNSCVFGVSISKS